MQKSIVLGLIMACLMCGTAGSATINVPGAQPTIQQGIDAANPGDTVLVAPNTYTGDLNRDLEFGGKAIVVKSEAGPEQTIINSEGSEAEPHRAFRFVGGEDNNAIVDGFKMIDGYGPYERDRNIGGGIYCEYSSPTIKNCIFEDNLGPVDGGAISGFGAGPIIIDCQFLSNSAIHGGAIFLNGGLAESASAQVLNSKFYHNSAREYDGYGGALYFQYNNISVLVENSIFYDNQAYVAGAMGVASSGHLTMNSCTITRNSGMYGSAIFGSDASIDIGNTLIAFNKIGYPVEAYGGSPFEISCSDVFGNTPGNYVFTLSGWDETNGNFSANPYFCDIAEEDFHVLDISECLPANNTCGELVGLLGEGCSMSANTYKVEADGSGDAVTIQEGINLSNYGDTLIVGPGTYSGEGNRDLFFGGKLICLTSQNGPEQTIIDCEGTEDEPHRGFTIDCAENSSLVIDGFTVSGGYGLFERNRNIGGAIYLEHSFPIISNCIFENNVGPVDGGAISGFGAGPEITNCMFNNNNAIHGGAIFFNGTVERRVAANIAGCGFYNNSARLEDGYGGAMYYQYDDITVNLDQCTFSGNQAYSGGAISCGAGSFTNITNTTMVQNSASFGGGMLIPTYNVSIDNSIFAFNTGDGLTSGGDIQNLSCTDVFGNTPNNLNGFSTDYLQINNNFSLEPFFCDLENGDLSLYLHSPCAPENNDCLILIGAYDVGCGIGDVNDDLVVNVSDAVYIINYIFLSGPAPDPYATGDCNCDGKVNITDAVWIINYVFLEGKLPGDLDGDGIPDC